MCLIAFAFQMKPDLPLIVTANRDEFYSRPTRPMHWWPSKDILAGKDLQAGGTWLGLSRNGRFAAVTNLRSATVNAKVLSRGSLVTDFLFSAEPAKKWLTTIIPAVKDYMGFNLLLFDGDELILFNSNNITKILEPGIYAFSNTDPDILWPKMQSAKASLSKYLVGSYNGNEQLEKLSALLSSRKTFEGQHAADTGVPLELEKLMSSSFIVAENYGTRSCTAVIAARKNIAVMENCYRKGVLEQTNKFFYEL